MSTSLIDSRNFLIHLYSIFVPKAYVLTVSSARSIAYELNSGKWGKNIVDCARVSRRNVGSRHDGTAKRRKSSQKKEGIRLQFVPVSHSGRGRDPGGRVELFAAGVAEQLAEVGLAHAAARHHDHPLPAGGKRRSGQLGDQLSVVKSDQLIRLWESLTADKQGNYE